MMNDKDSYTLADFVTEDKLITLAKEGKQAYGNLFYLLICFLNFFCLKWYRLNMILSLDQISKHVQELTALVRSVQSGTEKLRNKKFDTLYANFSHYT